MENLQTSSSLLLMKAVAAIQAVNGRQNDGNYKAHTLFGEAIEAVSGRQNDGNYKAAECSGCTARAVRGLM